MLLDVFFRGPESFSRVGVAVEFEGGPEMIYAVNGNMIADKDALEDVYSLKGASGFCPCPRCDALMVGALADPNFPRRRASTNVEITTLKKNAFTQSTNESIFALCDMLSEFRHDVDAKRLTKEKFELMELTTGITYNANGIMFNKRSQKLMPPLDTYTDDWAHSYLAKGVGGDELYNLLKALKQKKVSYAALQDECKSYEWPRSRDNGKYSWQVFAEKRAESNKEGWKSSMSEFLYILPIILQFAQSNFGHSLPNEVESFRRLAEVIDYIQALKYGHVRRAKAGTLTKLQESHFEKHLETYGPGLVKPKWHSGLHFDDQINRDGGIVLDTLTNERENKVPKAFGDAIQKIADFSRVVLARSLAHQINALKKLKEYPHLLGAPHWREEIHAWIPHSLDCGGLVIGTRDIIRNQDGEYVEILACGQTDRSLFILGDQFIVLEQSRTTARLQRLVVC